MYLYKIKFLGGSVDLIRANSPRHAFELAKERFKDLEIVFIKFLK